VLTYLLGPFLALLPQRWRKLLPVGSTVDWRRATVLSGFAEAVIALVALMYWYSHYMALLVSNGLDSALAGKMGPHVTDQEIGFTALVIWATHPLTWLIAYAGIEGSVRLVAAAFSETNLGVFPLFLVDKIIGKLSARSGQTSARADGHAEGYISSYVGAIREKTIYNRLPQIPDEFFSPRAGLMNSWRFARAGEKRTGIPRALCVTGTLFTGWRLVQTERCLGPFAIRCENCRRE
jgi:hypothetical protein